jgi:hypothetical protein
MTPWQRRPREPSGIKVAIRAGRPAGLDGMSSCIHLDAQRKDIVVTVGVMVNRIRISASAGFISDTGTSRRLTNPEGVSPNGDGVKSALVCCSGEGKEFRGVAVDVFSPGIRKGETARPSPPDLCLFERFSGS